MAGELKTDLISENTAAAGVTIDGALIKDGTINSKIPLATVLTGATDAIPIATSLVVINRTGAVNATTLAAPTTAQNGIRLTITNGTTQANTITAASTSISDGTTGGHGTVTFAAFIGASIELVAYNERWHVVSRQEATVT